MNGEKVLELIRDYWGMIIAVLGGAVWIGSVQHELRQLKKDVYVTDGLCLERRASCDQKNALQFNSGALQFAEIKKMIAENDRASIARHNELMTIIMKSLTHRDD